MGHGRASMPWLQELERKRLKEEAETKARLKKQQLEFATTR